MALLVIVCFLRIGPAIEMAGPAVLLGYGVAGIIAFLIMRQLGEMVVEEPVSGSFAHFAYKYWGPFAGFLSGWNYWVMFVLVGMAERPLRASICSTGSRMFQRGFGLPPSLLSSTPLTW